MIWITLLNDPPPLFFPFFVSSLLSVCKNKNFFFLVVFFFFFFFAHDSDCVCFEFNKIRKQSEPYNPTSWVSVVKKLYICILIEQKYITWNVQYVFVHVNIDILNITRFIGQSKLNKLVIANNSYEPEWSFNMKSDIRV